MFQMRNIILFFLFTTVSALGQNRLIKGRIIEKGTGRPVKQAILRIPSMGKSTQTDSTGTFNLFVAVQSRYEISVRHLSYESVFKTVNANNEDTLNILIPLTPLSRFLDSVTIVADPKPETLV